MVRASERKRDDDPELQFVRFFRDPNSDVMKGLMARVRKEGNADFVRALELQKEELARGEARTIFNGDRQGFSLQFVVGVKNSLHCQLELSDDLSEVKKPLNALANLTDVISAFEDKRAKLVQECRKRGWIWAHIAEALNVTRQSAWERYSSAEDD